MDSQLSDIIDENHIIDVSEPIMVLPSVDEISFQISFDSGLRAITVRSNGFWSLQESNRFLAILGRFISEMRRLYGTVRLIIDARNCSVQSAEAAACFSRAGRTLYKTGDQMAVIATSPLVQMQFQRVLTKATSLIFPTPREASAWLAAKH